MGQLSAAIRTADGRERIEIRLEPPELGRVRVEFEIVDRVVTAVVTAERSETLDLMRRNAESLLRDLAAARHENINLAFSSGSGGEAPEDRPTGAGRETVDAAPADAASRRPVPAARAWSAGLDIRL